MECLHVTEVLSAALDGEITDTAEIDRAHIHCETCAQCAAFARSIERFASLPAPVAPSTLLDRLRSVPADAASAAALEAATEPSCEPRPVSAASARSGRFRAFPRFAPAAAAAVVLVAAGISAIALLGTPSGGPLTVAAPEGADDANAVFPAESPDASRSGYSDATLSSSAGSWSADPGDSAPEYVTLDGGIWRTTDAPPPALSLLAPAGTAWTALGEADVPPATVRMLGIAGAKPHMTVWADLGDGAYMPLERVWRRFDGRDYALVSDAPIDRFGVWPALPARIQAPQRDDGWPTLTAAGVDARGVTVYVPTGGVPAGGFAIPPGTTADDPAGGNPGWTWWEPLR